MSNVQMSGNVYNVIHNLSEILGDYGGYLTDATIVQVTIEVPMAPPGLLIPGELILEYGKKTLGCVSYPMMDYNTQVSYHAYLTWVELSNSGSNHRIIGSQIRNIVVSPLLILSQGIDTPIGIAIKALYLEVYTLYLQLLEVGETKQYIDYTILEIKSIVNNIRWIAFQLENYPDAPIRYPLIQLLRELDRSISFIGSQN